MAPQVVTRSQRRMEKKQALFLLILILGVSLVSFSLGVMGGRASLEAEEEPAPERISVKAVIPSSGGEEGGGVENSTEDLTFFDTLPAGEQPLGSGINLPPQEEVRKVAAPVKTDETRPEKVSVVKEVPAEVPPPATPRKEAKVAPQGAWVVQVASFPNDSDANALRDRLTAKGYQASIQRADLKAKGVWYRVVLGPFSSQEAASQEGDRFQSREKTTVLVRRR